MTVRYRIPGWDDHFETATSRKLKHPYWVSLPNKQSGKGFTRIMVQEDGAAIFGLWVLIVEACSAQLPPRAGWLTDNGTAAGVPWTVEDLAERWRRRPNEVARALEVLCSPKVAWLECIDHGGRLVGDSPSDFPLSSPVGPVQQGGANAAAQEPAPGGDPQQRPAAAEDPQGRDERRRLIRVRLARLRFASGDTELEEWVGLLKLEAKCGDILECLDCLNWLKREGKREGVVSRYATAYEGLANRWHHQNHRPKAVNPNPPEALPEESES